MTLERDVRRWRRRAILGAYLGTLGTHAAVALAAASSAALLARVLLDLPASQAALAFLVVAATPFTAWIRSSRRFLSKEGTAAWLDLLSGGTGLLLADFEARDERWAGRAQQALAGAGPPPRLRVSRVARFPAMASAFAAAALLVPVPERVPGPPTRLYDAALERLAEKLKTLEETVALEEKVAEELRAQLRRLEEETPRARPEAAFEAIDRAEERLAAEAERVGEEAARALESLPGKGEASADPAAAEVALEKTMAELAEAGLARNLPASFRETLGAGTLRLPEGATLTDEQVATLSQELRDMLAGKLDDLAKAGLLKPGSVGGEGNLASLEGFEFADHECDEECEEGGG